MASTDTFERYETNGWGPTDCGELVWQTDPYMDPINLAAYHVDGTYAQFDPEASQGVYVPGEGSNGWDGFIGFLDDPRILALNGAMELRAIMSIANTTTEGDDEVQPQFYIAHTRPITSPYVGWVYDWWHGFSYMYDPAESYIETFGPGDGGGINNGFLNVPYYAPGTLLNIHVVWHSDGLVEASMWPVGDAEPSGWMVSDGGGWTPPADREMDTFYVFVPNIGQSVRIHDFAITQLPCVATADWGVIATGWGS